MLSGRYPADEFSGLRPRVTWDRKRDLVRAREGTQSVVVANAGTIPDRGLFGVFLAGAEGAARRVGELDEEMVFESREGDVFVLGASSWRIVSITHDRVLVQAAPGEPGEMPFWKADRGSRPVELGRAIGRLTRELRRCRARRRSSGSRASTTSTRAPRATWCSTSTTSARPRAACPTTARWCSSARATRWGTGGCACSRPGAAASTRRGRSRLRRGCASAASWSSSRSGATTASCCACPSASGRPRRRSSCPTRDALRDLVVRELPGTSLYAGRFREAAARALLLPRRRPGQRSPLWMQRKRAHELLQVAARYPAFPIVLEAARECLNDVFDLPALVDLARRVQTREIRLVTVDTQAPSPFAASLLFGYVANYLYDGDAPLAERRAQVLSVDTAELRELVGGAELRGLLDRQALEALELKLQALAFEPGRGVTSPDRLHDLLLRLGDLSLQEVAARLAPPEGTPAVAQAQTWLAELVARHACDGRRDRRRSALRGGRGRRPSRGRARHRAARGPARGVPRAAAEPVARARRALRAHARPVPRDRRGAPARRPGDGRGSGARRARARRPCAARRVPTGRPRPRVDRGRRALDVAPSLARRAAPRGRAGRARSACAPARGLARGGPGRRSPGPRRAPRRGRAPPGPGAARVDPRARRAARASARLPAGGPRHALGRGRGGLGGPGPPRRAGRPPGAVPRRRRAVPASTAARAARGRGARPDPRAPRVAGRVVLRGDPCGRRRRARRARRRGALGPGVGRRGHERHALGLARLPRRAHAAHGATAAPLGFPLAPTGPGRGGRPLEPAGAPQGWPEPNRAAEGARRAAAQAARRPHPRRRGVRGRARRLPGRVPRAADARRSGPHPPRLLRDRPGRLAVRRSRCPGAAACAARRRSRRAPGGRARRGRSGEPVRGGTAVAEARRGRGRRRGRPDGRPPRARGGAAPRPGGRKRSPRSSARGRARSCRSCHRTSRRGRESRPPRRAPSRSGARRPRAPPSAGRSSPVFRSPTAHCRRSWPRRASCAPGPGSG